MEGKKKVYANGSCSSFVSDIFTELELASSESVCERELRDLAVVSLEAGLELDLVSSESVFERVSLEPGLGEESAPAGIRPIVKMGFCFHLR
jgi:hypothetical protein